MLVKSLAALGAAVMLAAAQPNSSPEGYWLTEKKSGIVEIFRCSSDMLCGRLAWFRIKPSDEDQSGLDVKNPDPSRRNQSECGLVFMSGFKPAGPANWEDGSVYSPDDGHTYRANITLRADGTLRLHGYIGISLIGASEIWTRYTDPVPQCPTRGAPPG